MGVSGGYSERLAWGPRRPVLPARADRWLRQRTGAAPEPGRAVWPGPLPAVADSALSGPAATDLAALLGATWVRTDPAERLAHAGGMSYTDLLRRRAGEPGAVPDAVLCPADHDQVAALLRVCARHDVAVVPFGGGTSVVGGVEALRGGHAAVVTVDLSRLDRLLGLDRESLTATWQAGLTGPRAEALLGAHGLTLGHLPQSFERATLGGFAATRSAGQASAGYGRFDEMVLGLRLATPTGELRLGRGPASAAGPDLRQLVLGSEGAFGIITELVTRVRPVGEHRRYEAWSLPSFAAGVDVVRRLAQHGGPGALPDVTRLSDPAESEATLALGSSALLARAGQAYLRARGQPTPCLLVLGWEGGAGTVRARRALATPVLRRAAGRYLGQSPGRSWRRNRFGAPYLRDTLLDAGWLVETLETAADWSRLTGLRAAVGAALRDALTGPAARPVVGCHLSHAYPSGGSLYFTVLAGRDRADPVGQWQRAKRAAGAAIVSGGGTITHHHAVGLAHRPWLAAEIGDLGVDVLRAVKARLDPTGICNPGTLLPPAAPASGSPGDAT